MMVWDLNRQQAWWSLFLNWFVFVIYHCPGHLSAELDRLSRRLDHAVSLGGHDNRGQMVVSREQLVKWTVVVTRERCAFSEVVERVAVVQKIVADGAILTMIREASSKDPKVMPLWTLDTVLAVLQSWLKEFTVDNSLVQFHNLVYALDSNKIKRQILWLYHNSIPVGHPEQANTLALIAWNYYWPYMSEFVCQYMESCEMYQRIKL